MDKQGNNRHMQYRPWSLRYEMCPICGSGYIISDHCATGTLVTATKRVKASGHGDDLLFLAQLSRKHMCSQY